MEDKKEEPNNTSKKITSPKKTTKKPTADNTKPIYANHDEETSSVLKEKRKYLKKQEVITIQPKKKRRSLVRPKVKLTEKVFDLILHYAPFVRTINELRVLAGVPKQTFIDWLKIGKSLESVIAERAPKYILDKDLYEEKAVSATVPSLRLSIYQRRCLSLYVELGEVWTKTNVKLFAEIMAGVDNWQARHKALQMRLRSNRYSPELDLTPEELEGLMNNKSEGKKELTIEQKRAIAEIAGVKYDG